MIRITSKKVDYIRCGVVHPKGERNYPDRTFSENEVKVLKGDPNLKIEIIRDDIQDKESKSSAKKKDKKEA